jgi:two-component sensor histidine kinase
MRNMQPVFSDQESRNDESTVLSSSAIRGSLAREERLQLIVNELGHRAKNLLTVVQSIASQTAQHSSDLATFHAAFSERLAALSRSLDLLLHEGEQGVSIMELVRRQLQPFSNGDGGRVVISGSPGLLTKEATQDLGLALHELATNAMKYGALSVPEGRVSVSWTLSRGNPGSERFRLIWRERNGPPVTPPDYHGFGSMVLKRIVEATLSGSVQHDFGVGGVSWTLETPAAAILSVKPATIVGVSER